MISNKTRTLLFTAAFLAASAGMASPTHGSNPVSEPGQAAQATRTVTVDMTDNMRYTAGRDLRPAG